MPYRRAVGSTVASFTRLKIEYRGCSETKRSRPRRSAAHWASTMSSAGNVDDPIALTLPACTRSLRAERDSPTSVAGSGRCI